MKKILLTSLFLFLSSIVLSQEVFIELFKSGFNKPLNIQHVNDSRLFVVEQGGKIKIIQPDGNINPTPFLDISSQVSNGNEQGLLGLAFHPNYSNNGYFYVDFTDVNGDTRISRFSVDPSNPDLALSNSELELLGFDQPFSNHNGGNLLFGPDGYLYISSGDGGSGGDPNNNGQNINSYLGKLLRIDVDNPTAGSSYGIPSSNPFVGNPNAKQEIFAYGLRNPWRFSIDEVENNIWIADVGQGNWEEINRAPLDGGGLNYGWRCYEGTHAYNIGNCPQPSELQFPIAEYSHSGGNCSITGGYVYRGSVFSDIAGLYFYADYCSGMIGTIDSSGNMINHGNFSGNWVSFGQSVDKELFIIDISGGSIYKIKGGELAGVSDYSNSNQLQIITNSSTSTITFILNNDTLSRIQLFDLKGSLINSIENISERTKSIPTDSLRAGVYLAKVTTGEGSTLVKKVIIK